MEPLDGGYHHDGGLYGDGFYGAPYSPRYYGAIDIGCGGCGFGGWDGYGNYAGYGGYSYDGYGW